MEDNDWLLFLTQQAGTESIYFLHSDLGLVVRSIDPPGNDTIGSMAYDGKVIRVANVASTAGSRTGMINSIDPEEGWQVASIPAPEGRGEGLAFDGKDHLIYSTGGAIYRLDKNTGATLESHTLPDDVHCTGLTCDWERRLFAGDCKSNEIVEWDLETLEEVSRIVAPGGGQERVHGLAYHKGKERLYVANQSDQTIYYGTV
jgi:hypothetical protein